MTMKKYTIVFEDGVMSGSHFHNTTKMHRVETDNIKELMKSNYDGCIYFVLEGHPELIDDYQYDTPIYTHKFRQNKHENIP